MYDPVLGVASSQSVLVRLAHCTFWAVWPALVGVVFDDSLSSSEQCSEQV